MASERAPRLVAVDPVPVTVGVAHEGGVFTVGIAEEAGTGALLFSQSDRVRVGEQLAVFSRVATNRLRVLRRS
jgi:hypothetical protein